MKKTLKILNFFRLVDENALLSLTNIVVIIVAVKLAMAPSLDFAAVAALLAGLSGYGFKRYVHKDKPTESRAEVDEKRLQDIEDKLSKVAFAAGFKKK